MHNKLFKPSISIWFGYWEYNVIINFGWYRGNPFNTLSFRLLGFEEGFITIFEIQVAKFLIGLYLDEEDDD